jgi:hypothetical protein
LKSRLFPKGVPVYLTEAEIKLQGEIWVIHKNDADPFPSNPHAHNYQQRLKMHLGNGDLYMYKQKQPCRRLRKSVFLEFRERVTQRTSSIVLPPLAL